MARSLASSIAANLALLAFATASLSAEQSNSLRARGEAPPASHIDANQLHGQIGQGIEMEEALWQVQVYSTYQFKPEEIAEDKALPRTHPDKLFLDELAPWEREHRCGGVHIGDMWILTAAHCISKIRPVSDVLTLRRIRVGTTELDLDHGATFRVERAVIHSHYSGLQGHQLHDIALLKIEPDPDTNQEAAAKLKQIRVLGDLPGDRPLANFDNVWASGWGLVDVRQYGALPLKANGDLMHGSPILLKVDLLNYAQSRCTDIPELQSFSGPGVICAGSSEPGKDACQGDSGGPLVRIDGPDMEHAVLVGLVSTGKGCGLPGVPGIYTNVPNFRTWIANAKNAPAGQVSRR